jgi:cell division protein FtsZ
MVFITAGMGGGTGTGAAPIIAKLAREMNILTVGIVTKPFHFEGKIRAAQAQEGIDELRQHVDSLVVINNDKLREVYGNLTFRSGFAKADEVLATAAKGIAEVITYHYTTNIDLRDLRTVLENSGTAIMGSSSAKGSDRAKLAVTQALDSPLLNDNHINGAKNVLLLITSGSGDEEITMDEMGFINEHIQDEAGGNANVILGVGIDETLENTISVTVIATGFPSKQNNALTGRTEPKIVHPLDEDQPITKGIFEQPFAKIDRIEKPSKPVRPREPDLFSTINPPAEKVHDLYEEEEVEEDFDITDKAEKTAVDDVEPDKTTNQKDKTIATIVGSIFSLEYDLETEAKAEEEAVDDETEALFEIEDEDDFEYSFTEEDVITASSVFASAKGENEISFDLDDIDGEGIQLVSKDEKALPIAVEEETEYDPFDFRIDEVMAGEKPTVIGLEDEIEEEEDLVAEEIETPVADAEKPKVIKHTLDDFRELEQRLQIKKPAEQEEQKAAHEAPLSKVETKEEDDMFMFEVKQSTTVDSADVAEEIEEDILNRPISQASLKKILERKERLEQFAYKFRPRIADHLEKEPAYKRQGLNLGAEDHSSQSKMSQMSISGQGDQTEIKTNNSFLHDNVD